MTYKRKTQDEFQIWGVYGQGFEELTAESTRKAANERLKEYRENQPEGSYKIVVKRIPINF